MVWKRWAEEGGILYWDLTSIVENWPQLHSATHIQQKKKHFSPTTVNFELQNPFSTVGNFEFNWNFDPLHNNMTMLIGPDMTMFQ